MAKAKANKKADPMPAGFSYEASLQQLQDILAQLEGGQASFEEAVRLFQQGSVLVQQCQRYLDQTELVVQQLSADTEGNLREEEFA